MQTAETSSTRDASAVGGCLTGTQFNSATATAAGATAAGATAARWAGSRRCPPVADRRRGGVAMLRIAIRPNGHAVGVGVACEIAHQVGAGQVALVPERLILSCGIA